MVRPLVAGEVIGDMLPARLLGVAIVAEIDQLPFGDPDYQIQIAILIQVGKGGYRLAVKLPTPITAVAQRERWRDRTFGNGRGGRGQDFAVLRLLEHGEWRLFHRDIRCNRGGHGFGSRLGAFLLSSLTLPSRCADPLHSQIVQEPDIALTIADQQIGTPVTVKIAKMGRAVLIHLNAFPEFTLNEPAPGQAAIGLAAVDGKHQTAFPITHHQVRLAVLVPVEKAGCRTLTHRDIAESGRGEPEVGLLGRSFIDIKDDFSFAVAHEEIEISVPIDVDSDRRTIGTHVDPAIAGGFQTPPGRFGIAFISDHGEPAIAVADEQIQIPIAIQIGQMGRGISSRRIGQQAIQGDLPRGLADGSGVP